MTSDNRSREANSNSARKAGADSTLTLSRIRAALSHLPTRPATKKLQVELADGISYVVGQGGDPFGRNDNIMLVDSRGKDVVISVADLPLVLGRGRKCTGADAADVLIHGSGISGLHCRMERDAVLIRVVDLQSKNGTFLNGKSISSAFLREGDRLTFGSATYTVRRA